MRASFALSLMILSVSAAYASRNDSSPGLQGIPAVDIDRDAVAAQNSSLSTSAKFIAFAPLNRGALSEKEPLAPGGGPISSRWRRARETTTECVNAHVSTLSGYGRILGMTIGASAGVVLASPTFAGTAGGAFGGAFGGALAGDIIGRAADYVGCTTYHFAREAFRR